MSTLGVGLTLQTQPILQPIAESDTEGIAVFVNPLHPEVRTRLLNIIREIVQNYPIDGFVLGPDALGECVYRLFGAHACGV